ncbi:MAG: hypothetical protein QG575_831, partial [Euryarchaeota archaeon]|nr:hypothetical protein [Euryarchaeota archaeon]
ARLRSAEFVGVKLTDVDLSFADLRNFKAILTFMQNVNLSGADLRGANLTSLGLQAVDFTGANLEGIKYDENDETTLMMLANSNLTKAKISPDLQRNIKEYQLR